MDKFLKKPEGLISFEISGDIIKQFPVNNSAPNNVTIINPTGNTNPMIKREPLVAVAIVLTNAPKPIKIPAKMARIKVLCQGSDVLYFAIDA